MEVIHHFQQFQNIRLNNITAIVSCLSSSAANQTTTIDVQKYTGILDEILENINNNLQIVYNVPQKSIEDILKFHIRQVEAIEQFQNLQNLLLSKSKVFTENNSNRESAINQLSDKYAKINSVSNCYSHISEVSHIDSDEILKSNLNSETFQNLEKCNQQAPIISLTTIVGNNSISDIKGEASKSLNTNSCHYCSNSNHTLFRCSKFRKLNVQLRHHFILKHSLCFNCLYSGHTSKSCVIKSSCFKCQKRHSTLLHSSIRIHKENSKSQINNSEKIQKPLVEKDILPTAIIEVVDSSGTIHQIRALLDSSSQVSIITESCFNKLNLASQAENLNSDDLVKSYSHSEIYKKSVVLKLKSRLNETQTVLDCKAFISKQMKQIIPEEKFQYEHHECINRIKLADPTFESPSEIDLIIGAKLFFKLLQYNSVQSNSGKTVAILSLFGWIACGTYNS